MTEFAKATRFRKGHGSNLRPGSCPTNGQQSSRPVPGSASTDSLTHGIARRGQAVALRSICHPGLDRRTQHRQLTRNEPFHS